MDNIMVMCDYSCGREGKYYFKSVNKWCCSKSQNSCPVNSKKRNKTQKGKRKPIPDKITDITILCSYGCGNIAKYKYKNGKYCCSISRNKCPSLILKNKNSNKGRKPWNYKIKNCYSEETLQKMREVRGGENHWNYGNHWSDEIKKKIGDGNRGKIISEEQRQKQSILMSGENNPCFGKKRIFTKEEIRKQAEGRKLTIEKIKIKYPFFSKVEEMRYNPDKQSSEKEIQVHCKNHKCLNSKEQNGWFTPNISQIIERRRSLENSDGNDGHYFYCCDKCKDECLLYNLRGDPYQKHESPYTNDEYNNFRYHVLERDSHKCQYCGEKAEHVHHERPQKLEPFFALDPDLAWSVCKKCHYEKGHKDECSTGNLATKLCK